MLMLHREVAQGDKLLDDVRLPKCQVNLHINLTKSSRRRWIVARGCRGSPAPSWTPPMCRSCNPLRKSPAKLWPINNINLNRVRRSKAMTTRETSSHNFDQMSQRSQISKVKSSNSVLKKGFILKAKKGTTIYVQLLVKSKARSEIAHCCTIFLKSSGYRNMIDIEIQISISERSSGWAIN